ncbi:hypothetical protein [Butyrivibrio sp. FC2001]|uniref:hypothetical protein n=1 Tax=Butyrivibrio sp. FC2001 TaxID=1280671 RepID=UPI0004001B8F|nr:hypothetical protein [Butyrivibrio sp. FC2001]
MKLRKLRSAEITTIYQERLAHDFIKDELLGIYKAFYGAVFPRDIVEKNIEYLEDGRL